MTIANGVLDAPALSDLGSSVARLQQTWRNRPATVPPVMASPPTLVKQTDYAVTAIPGAVFIPATDPRIGFWNMAGAVVAFNGALNDGVPRDYFYMGAPISGSPRNWCVALRSDAPQLDLLLGQTTQIVVLVDGQMVGASQTVNTVSGSVRYIVSLMSGGEPKARDILIFGIGAIAGLYVGSADTVSAGANAPSGDRAPLRMSTIADSYGQTAGPRGIMATELALLLGISGFITDCVGGTGYLQNNGSVAYPTANNFLRRSQAGQSAYYTPATTWVSDLDVVLGGINDQASVTTADILAVLQARRALFPEAVIAVAGNWQPDPTYVRTSPPGKQGTIQTAIDAACAQLSGPWVQVDNVNGLWRNSSGRSGSLGGQPFQTGDGRTINFTGALTAATSGTLTTAWAGTTGSRTIRFSDGTTKTATLTNNSTAVAWSGAVTASAAAGAYTVAGNGTRYVSEDGTHPPSDGIAYLSALTADGIRKAVLAL